MQARSADEIERLKNIAQSLRMNNEIVLKQRDQANKVRLEQLNEIRALKADLETVTLERDRYKQEADGQRQRREAERREYDRSALRFALVGASEGEETKSLNLIDVAAWVRSSLSACRAELATAIQQRMDAERQTEALRKELDGLRPKTFEERHGLPPAKSFEQIKRDEKERFFLNGSTNTPQFVHNCASCVFLGWLVDKNGLAFDLYFCAGHGPLLRMGVLARYGNAPGDWHSNGSEHPDYLIEAERRARERGLLPKKDGA